MRFLSPLLLGITISARFFMVGAWTILQYHEPSIPVSYHRGIRYTERLFMAKTMRRIVITAILLIALAGVAVAGVYLYSSGTAIEGVRTNLLNSAIEQFGLKDQIEGNLRQRATSLAEEYGLPSDLFDGVIDSLAIDQWKVVDTPTDTASTKTVELDVEGSPIQVTLYDDPSYISIRGEGTINTFGQTITLEVPESAQSITGLLPYYDAAEEIGILDLIGAPQASSEAQ